MPLLNTLARTERLIVIPSFIRSLFLFTFADGNKWFSLIFLSLEVLLTVISKLVEYTRFKYKLHIRDSDSFTFIFDFFSPVKILLFIN